MSGETAVGRPSRGGRVTIVDVAKAANVSVSSASRALNKPGRLSAETEKRIREVAEELGYRPNPAARALPTGRTGSMGLLVADISNPVTAQVIRGAQRAAAERGYVLLIHEFLDEAELSSERLERIAFAVDGFVMSMLSVDLELVAQVESHRPVVTVNRAHGGYSVSGRPAAGIGELVDYLQGVGHTSMVYVSGPEATWINGERWAGAQEVCAERGMTLTRIGPFEPTREGGAACADAVIESGASCALMYNDLMAIGLMHEVQSRGLRVPGDLSMAGFENVFGCDFTTPPMTTIEVPLEEMAYGATIRLADLLEGRDVEPSARISTSVILRGSTGPVLG